jgi:hypothetical protein
VVVIAAGVAVVACWAAAMPGTQRHAIAAVPSHPNRVMFMPHALSQWSAYRTRGLAHSLGKAVKLTSIGLANAV